MSTSTRHPGPLVLTAIAAAALTLAVAGCSALGDPVPPATPSVTPVPSAPAAPTATATAEPTGASTGASTAAPTAAPAAEACKTGELTIIARSRPQDSGMSQFYWDLSLTNAGEATCSLTGYPSISMMEANTGAVVGNPAAQSPGTITTVSLDPGAVAYSLLHLTQAGAYDCRLVTVSKLAVTAPSQDTPSTVKTPNRIQGCDGDYTLIEAGVITDTKTK